MIHNIPYNLLEETAKAVCGEVYVVGYAVKAGNALTAISEGYKAALEIGLTYEKGTQCYAASFTVPVLLNDLSLNNDSVNMIVFFYSVLKYSLISCIRSLCLTWKGHLASQ